MGDSKLHNKCLCNLHTCTQLETFSKKRRKCIIEMKTHFVKEILLDNQKITCNIIGMTIISEAEILCADGDNKSLVLVNYVEGKITSTLETSSRPADVTTIYSSSAATTLPDEGKILFLNTQNGLSVSHSLTVRERCTGIDYKNDMMAVTFIDPPAVQILDIGGHILHKVMDTSILMRPLCVSLGNTKESMFVSDWDNNEVHEFTINGHLKSSFKVSDMEHLAGLAVTTCGLIVVCSPDKRDTVGVIVPDTKEIIPMCVQHAVNPASILICEEQRKLFISEFYKSKDCKYIKEYDLM